MRNYRTFCSGCNQYVYMGDLVACQKGAACGLQGTHEIEEIPLDFDRTSPPNATGIEALLKAAQVQAIPATAPVSASDRQVGGDHYASQAIQPIHYIFENNLGFCEGNVIKYVTRYQKKNGVEDLKKARHYIDMLIERLERP